MAEPLNLKTLDIDLNNKNLDMRYTPKYSCINCEYYRDNICHRYRYVINNPLNTICDSYLRGHELGRKLFLVYQLMANIIFAIYIWLDYTFVLFTLFALITTLNIFSAVDYYKDREYEYDKTYKIINGL